MFEHVQLKDCLCGTSLLGFSHFTEAFGMALSTFKREHIKKNLRNDEYDLVHYWWRYYRCRYCTRRE
ncbi:hypothetical protein ACVXZZ_14040 [Staphylococcus aureus]